MDPASKQGVVQADGGSLIVCGVFCYGLQRPLVKFFIKITKRWAKGKNKFQSL